MGMLGRETGKVSVVSDQRRGGCEIGGGSSSGELGGRE